MTPDKPDPTSEPVATGDRRDEVRLQPDPDQLVRLRATFRPDAPLPPDEQSASSEAGERGAAPPIEDVAVAKPSPSVWDARPADEAAGSEPSGTPKGH